MSLSRGIDVSHHNGTVNWSALKSKYGISWGAAKATEGKTFKDSQFPTNWQSMKAAGITRLAYHFAHPDSDPTVAAKVFLDYVKASGLTSNDFMVMDMESNPNKLPLLEVRDWLAGWADIVTKETGHKPILYTGSGYITNNATKDLKSHYTAWWFPRYPAAYDGRTIWPSSIPEVYPQPNNWGVPDIWQFSQSFAGAYDANVATMSFVRDTPKPSIDWTKDLSVATLAEVRNIVREELKLAALDGQPIHELVQIYSAFGAKHTDQVEATTAGDVDLVLKDDFQSIVTKLTALQTTLSSILTKVNSLSA